MRHKEGWRGFNHDECMRISSDRAVRIHVCVCVCDCLYFTKYGSYFSGVCGFLTWHFSFFHFNERETTHTHTHSHTHSHTLTHTLLSWSCAAPQRDSCQRWVLWTLTNCNSVTLINYKLFNGYYTYNIIWSRDLRYRIEKPFWNQMNEKTSCPHERLSLWGWLCLLKRDSTQLMLLRNV